MMVTLERLRLEISGLDEAELERWIGAALVRAEGAEGARLFEEIDVARIRLIFELRHELEIEEQALPVVLSLMDQLYDLRRRRRETQRGAGGPAPGGPPGHFAPAWLREKKEGFFL